MHCVIVGGGAAGLQAARTCRQLHPDRLVTLIDAEEEIGYYRALLPQFMTGKLEEEKLFSLIPEGPFFVPLTGVRVSAVDRSARLVRLESGEELAYDHLILAPGGRPIMPPLCVQQSCNGIYPIRDLTTARAIKKWLPNHQNVVILGGGLVGVKTAVILVESGLKVTVVEKENHLLPQALSPDAAARVATHLREIGVSLILGSSVHDIYTRKGALTAVETEERRVPCQSLLVAAGSHPRVAFLEDSGLLEDGALVVNQTLRTSDERIYGAGDAVTIRGEGLVTPWTWPQAVSQGKLAAANLYASAPASLRVLTRVNCMNLHGLPLAILGAPVPGAEVMRLASPADAVFRELFIIESRIVGGALVGDISGAGPLHALMNSGTETNAGNTSLLKPSKRTLAGLPWSFVGQKRRAHFFLQRN
jgi:NADPH-dependent 2,4-dienoyl-CoA reductase/sulfur reductase-like enzyme